MKKVDEVKKIARRKELTGKVVSTKMNKTVIVEVMRITNHPLYKKAMRLIKRFAAHNELPDIAVGDTVRMHDTRPISKTKHFIVVEKIR